MANNQIDDEFVPVTKIKTHGHTKGCMVCGCRLSIYNKGRKCALHEDKMTVKEKRAYMYNMTSGTVNTDSPAKIYRTTYG